MRAAAAPARFGLPVVLLLFAALISGCNEQFLASLTPEQRAFFLSLTGDAGQPDPLSRESDSDSAAAEEESELPFSHARLADDDLCPQLIPGPPIGLSCLHCNQPEARDAALDVSLLLFRSCVQSVAINYLVDGTFSFDEALMMEQISLLTSNGRSAHVYFYLANGSTQRRWSVTSIDAFATTIEPAAFRKLIADDHQLRFEYQLLAMRLLPTIRYAVERGASVSVIPMLEDNLDDESFRELSDLAREVIPPELGVTYGRNACANCYAGNTTGTPADHFVELHLAHPYFNFSGGLITNDGKTYCFEAEDENCDLSLDDLKTVRDRAAETANTFILWSGQRQGLPVKINGVARFAHPQERSYARPSLAERMAIIEFLRGG